MRYLLLMTALLLAGDLWSSEDYYAGPPLSTIYKGAQTVHNSQFLYASKDRLDFEVSDYLTEYYPQLLPLTPVINTWSSRYSVNPKIASLVLNEIFPPGTDIQSVDFNQVKDVIWGLRKIYETQGANNPLAASAALSSVTTAWSVTHPQIPDNLKTDRSASFPKGSNPSLMGYLQPPWPIGESWAGGGAHSAWSALDFWKFGTVWGDSDIPNWSVVASQDGVVNVTSACGLEVIHANGWITGYYHLEQIAVNDNENTQRNQHLSGIADTQIEATCAGGFSTGPHQHVYIRNPMGNPATTNEYDYTVFRHENDFIVQYDGDCMTSKYIHQSEGTVCPYFPNLLNNAANPSDNIYTDGFE